MRITDLRSAETDGNVRASATVVWEDSEHPPFELYFETSGRPALDLESNAHAYVVACIVPAMHFGETRISVASELCPELITGLKTNMLWLQHFSDGRLHPVRIECGHRRTEYPKRSRRRSASFLSGGVDSLATLRRNRLDFEVSHPASIQDCLLVHGFDIGGISSRGEEETTFGRALAALGPVAQDAGVELIPIKSNVRLLYDDTSFWMKYLHGAALASVAHSLARRIARVYIASSDNIPPIPPAWGSHPLLDPNYGSYDLQIRHDGLHLTRLDKVRLLAGWDVALDNLRVCTANVDSQLNCGKCEKCIRTMLELLAVGKLDETDAFPSHTVDPDLLGTLHLRADELAYYEEVVEPLAAQGHKRLARAVQASLVASRARLAWEMEQDWKGAVKRFDRAYLRSGLYRTWKALRSRVTRLSSRNRRP